MTFPLMDDFLSVSNKFLTIFCNLTFHISLPRLCYFFVKNENLKFENETERGIRKIFTFVKILSVPKIFGNWYCPCDFKNTQVTLRTIEQIQILKHRLESITRDLKVLWIARVFSRKLFLVSRVRLIASGDCRHHLVTNCLYFFC